MLRDLILGGALLLAPLGGPGVRAEAPLSLAEAVSLARERSPLLDVHAQSVKLAEATLKGARGASLPSMSMGLSYRYAPSDLVVQGLRLNQPDHTYGLTSSAVMPLFTGFRNQSNRDASESELEASERTFDRSVEEVTLSACLAYLEVLRREALLEVARTNLERSRGQRERVEALEEVGSVPPVDVYRQRSQFGNDRLAMIQARDALENARNALNVSLGLDVNQRRALVPLRQSPDLEFASRSFEDLMARARENRPDLAASRHRLESAEAGVGVARSGYYPTLDASASYGWTDEQIPGDSQHFFGRDNYSFGVSMSIPIFDRRLTGSAVDRSRAVEAYQVAVLENLDREIARGVADATLAVRNANERVSVAADNVAASREELRLASERYEVGAGTLLERNTAASALTAAEADGISAEYDLLYAALSLNFQLGEPVASVLAATNGTAP